MIKKKKIIITVSAISIAFIGVLTLLLNTDLINKLKSSVIDPLTGETCIEETESANIIHEDDQSVKSILDDLYSAKDSTCATGYSCNKPVIPAQVEPESCFTLSTDHIYYSVDNHQMTVEDAIKELYRIYNTPNFCPQKYCNPNTYTITLDKNGGTTQGTEKIYEKFDTNIYLDENETLVMDDNNNPITKPTKVYTITYDANGQGATFTPTPAESVATFNGYFTESSGGTKLIDENGYIVPNNFPNNKFSENTTIYAQYTNTAITLPAITKTNATCKWAEGSTSGTEYTGGTSRTISGNTTYYAKCVSNPIITVINKTCNEDGGSCTEQSRTTYQKALGTTETISPGSYSGYSAPSSKSVTYDANHTLTFNHTKVKTLTYASKYNSGLLKANHTNGHTDLYLPSGSRSYGYIVPADASSSIQWPSYSSTSSTTYSGFPYIIVLKDSGSATNYEAAFSGANYSNGVKGTYYVRTCNMQSDNTESCTNAEELRPYVELRYDLKGGSGTSSNQSKYSGQSITLHGTPTKSGYTFRGWAAQTSGGDQCMICQGSGGACIDRAYYAAGTTLDGQDWNVGNESWPCASKEMYQNGTNIVYLRAVWNRNPWIDYN